MTTQLEFGFPETDLAHIVGTKVSEDPNGNSYILLFFSRNTYITFGSEGRLIRSSIDYKQFYLSLSCRILTTRGLLRADQLKVGDILTESEGGR